MASSATAPKSSGPKSNTHKRDRRPSATHGTTRGPSVRPKKRKRANEEETADEEEATDDETEDDDDDNQEPSSSDDSNDAVKQNAGSKKRPFSALESHSSDSATREPLSKGPTAGPVKRGRGRPRNPTIPRDKHGKAIYYKKKGTKPGPKKGTRITKSAKKPRTSHAELSKAKSSRTSKAPRRPLSRRNDDNESESESDSPANQRQKKTRVRAGKSTQSDESNDEGRPHIGTYTAKRGRPYESDRLVNRPLNKVDISSDLVPMVKDVFKDQPCAGEYRDIKDQLPVGPEWTNLDDSILNTAVLQPCMRVESLADHLAEIWETTYRFMEIWAVARTEPHTTCRRDHICTLLLDEATDHQAAYTGQPSCMGR